ncbi:hypothetical protein M2158_008160 [Streptomyces sp. SAI-144]|uniref:hypothetical protein n=1 Tax=Streptomyces sp. SAI-144 TaxID=2940544 RepID=UPI00247666E5|nr:hypothetical protein [Streptomyces sp. SAI-144]MDH6439619.1 hypothetical protein [Streptomyces sp. SAI-144]
MKSACGGLLPYGDLRSLVPDAVVGEVSQYGTVLEPGEESRSLVNCAVTWPGHGSVRVRAAALVSPMPMSVKVEDIMAGAEEESYEVPGVTGRAGEDGQAWIVAECAGGLESQVRKVSQMYVTADVDLSVSGKGKQGRDLMGFRTAVHVANGITGRQKCGGFPARGAHADHRHLRGRRHRGS